MFKKRPRTAFQRRVEIEEHVTALLQLMEKLAPALQQQQLDIATAQIKAIEMQMYKVPRDDRKDVARLLAENAIAGYVVGLATIFAQHCAMVIDIEHNHLHGYDYLPDGT